MKKLIIFLMLALVLFVSGCTMSYDYETCSERGDCISMDQKSCLTKVASDYCVDVGYTGADTDWLIYHQTGRYTGGSPYLVTFDEAYRFRCTRWVEQTRTTKARGEGTNWFLYMPEEKESCRGGGD